MTAPTSPDLERDICRDYSSQENGRYVYTLAQVAARYGINISTVSSIRKRHGLCRYVYNMEPRKPKVEPQPTTFACPFCGTKCEVKAGHEVCR